MEHDFEASQMEVLSLQELEQVNGGVAGYSNISNKCSGVPNSTQSNGCTSAFEQAE